MLKKTKNKLAPFLSLPIYDQETITALWPQLIYKLTEFICICLIQRGFQKYMQSILNYNEQMLDRLNKCWNLQ